MNPVMNRSADRTKLRPDTGSFFTVLTQQIAEAESLAALCVPADFLAAQWPEMASDALVLPQLEKLLSELVRKSAQLEETHVADDSAMETSGFITSRTGNREK